MSHEHDCCIANDTSITKELFDSEQICCCNYRVIYSIFLFFAYFGAIVAWAMTYQSYIAVLWDLMYTAGCVLGTLGLIYNHYYGLIVLLTIFMFDSVIALLSISIIIQGEDTSPIIGKNSNVHPHSVLLCFLAFTILQSIFAFIIIKMIKAIQHHIAMANGSGALHHTHSYP